jgi:D-alanine-D-alanine ligase-like ATP-grasp enzyme/GNAT superfamily N-acetyltransferase
MNVLILHQAVAGHATPDEQDVIEQARAVEAALRRLGHETAVRGCTLDLHTLDAFLQASPPGLVFNLVESLGGSDRLIHLVPSLLEARGLGYAGCGAEALMLTSHKILAKRRMIEAGLPTPIWFVARPELRRAGPIPGGRRRRRSWMLKSFREHASANIDDSCLIDQVAYDRLPAVIETFSARFGGACFAEEYIDGREFNVSLLAGPDGPEALPPAEIRFVGFPPDKPKIVGYQAKWDEQSFESSHTERHFPRDARDAALLETLKSLSLDCWNLFGLTGWARVDFRVDRAGHPWILEVNANPCLSPDAGFAAAVAEAGIGFDQAMARIVGDAVSRHASQAAVAWSGVPPPGQATAAGLAGRPATALTWRYRDRVEPGDVVRVRELAAATGFFHRDEVDVAVELVEERLNKGAASGYEFVFAEQDGGLLGYSCFGPIPCTRSSYDLYWIVVSPKVQGAGIGRAVLAETERRIRALGGTRLYAETSSRAQYQATRAFYQRTGFTLAEVLADFYDHDDGRCTYVKCLEG